MNILVIGNGFDLAHGLPTRYTDFLEWIKDIEYIGERLDWEDEIPTTINAFVDWRNKREDIWTIKFDDKFFLMYLSFEDDEDRQIDMLKTSRMKNWISEHDNTFDFNRDIYYINEDIEDFLEEDRNKKRIKINKFSDLIFYFSKNTDSIGFYNEERIAITDKYLSNENALILFYLINCNFWVEYFSYRAYSLNKNWIDFEKEISNLVVEYDKGKRFISADYKIFVPKRILEKSESKVKILEDDLNRFILLLEIYLCVYVHNTNCTRLSKDIYDLKIEKIISFNYTNTYEKIYDNDKNAEYDYIHGKADMNHNIDTNNIVLGIDEYLPEDRINKDLDFLAFKKYYQRIYKETGCKYKFWMDQIREEWKNETEESKAEIRRCISKGQLENKKIHRLFIFGHSLDITDKDVLRDLILHDSVHTTIFYLNKEVMGQQIANLVKVIGQDELIKRTGGSTKTIEFKQQQDMVEINS